MVGLFIGVDNLPSPDDFQAIFKQWGFSPRITIRYD